MEKTHSVKSHEEITALFDELDARERRLRSPEPDSPLVILPVPEMPAPVSEPEVQRPVKARVKRTRFLTKKIRKPHRKIVFGKRKRTHSFVEMPGKPIPGTFSLRLDDDGRLVGFDAPKPKPPRKGAKGAEETGKRVGRFGKLGSLFSRKKAVSGGSRLSSLLGKMKIRGRRAKD